MSLQIEVIPNFYNEEVIDLVVNEIGNDKDFEKSDTETGTNESIDELNFPQEFEEWGIIILDDLNKKEMNDPRIHAKFQRSRHNKLSIFISSQDCYELPQRTVRSNGDIYHNFKLNNFRDVQNLYQDKALMDMMLKKILLFTSSRWNVEYQPLTNDMTKGK